MGMTELREFLSGKLFLPEKLPRAGILNSTNGAGGVFSVLLSVFAKRAFVKVFPFCLPPHRHLRS